VTFDSTLIDAVATHGAWLVGGAIAIESMGIPVPGETMLISAAVYAGASGKLDITHILVAAIVGAIAGDNAGFWIGRTVGLRWVTRHGSTLRLSPRRLKLGQYLFLRHGGKVVFFGRFVAVLRALAAVLAGVNCMAWRRFLLFNTLGGIIWAGGYGLAAYAFGDRLAHALGNVGIVLGVAAAVAVVTAIVVARRFERRLEDEAERELPGPLDGPHDCAPAGGES